jgi:hypothetical protein
MIKKKMATASTYKIKCIIRMQARGVECHLRFQGFVPVSSGLIRPWGRSHTEHTGTNP